MSSAKAQGPGATEPVGGSPSSLTGGWECPGVGYLSLNSNGTLTLYTGGGDGGGGGGGPGNPCGGGGGGGGDNGDGTVSPPGSRGGDQIRWGSYSCDSVVIEPPVICDPYLHPQCHRPLNGQDSIAIQRALSTYVRATFSDSQAQSQFTAMRQAFEILYEQGRVKRGKTDEPGIDGPHKAAYRPETGEMHFDPAHLDAAHSGSPSAVRDLLNSMLHESAHAMGKDHGPPIAGFYSEPYFKWLSPGANSCISW